MAADGEQAIQLWKRGQFDLILMDMHMPDVDGLEATRTIRRFEEASNVPSIPIIATTAAAMPEDVRRCLESGMNDFIAKPIQIELLEETLAKYGSRRSGNADPQTTEQSLETSPVQPLVKKEGGFESPEELTEILDLQNATKNIPGGAAGIARLRPIFELECRQLVDCLRSAMANRNRAEIQRIAHTLKGSAKLFCASRVVKRAFEMETAAVAEEFERLGEMLSLLEIDLAQSVWRLISKRCCQ